MGVSGRRAFPRFRTLGTWLGRLRISRQVAVNLTEPGLTVISDRPGVVDEELTLSLVQRGEQMAVQVRVVATNPQVLNGVLCHKLKLEVLGGQSDSAHLKASAR